MDKKILKAEDRKSTGRKVKVLRNQGFLPGNIYGKKIKSKAVQVLYKDFKSIYEEVGETGIVDIEVSGEKRPVLIHNLQKNPVSDYPIHVDFLQVDLKEKIETDVPVELEGESPAEKQSLGTVVQYINELKVEALPGDLPEKFLIDAANLSEVDQAVYVKDIKTDRSKVTIKNDPDEIIVKVEPPQKEEVIETPVAVEGEEGAATEGEGAAEGVTEKVEGATEGDAPKE